MWMVNELVYHPFSFLTISMVKKREKINNVTALKTSAVRYKCEDDLYSMTKPQEEATEAVAVPYYTWGNRGENQMRVFMPYK